MQFVAYMRTHSKVLFARRQTIAKQNVSRKWREMLHMLYIWLIWNTHREATRYFFEYVHKLSAAKGVCRK